MRGRTAVTLFLSILVLAAGTPGAALAGENIKFQVNTLRVDCDAGGLIQPALETDFVKPFAEDSTTIPPAAQLVIEFEGACVGDVFIERDDVILRGLGPDAAIVGEIVVLGAAKVRLEHFTQRDSEGHGIGVTRGGSIIVEDVRVRDNAGNGLSIYDHSAAWVIDSSFVGNRYSGIAMWGHASLKQSGGLRANENGFIGVFVNTGSAWDWLPTARELVTEANDNAVAGVALQFGATGWAENLTARRNGFAGLFLYASTLEARNVDLAGNSYGPRRAELVARSRLRQRGGQLLRRLRRPGYAGQSRGPRHPRQHDRAGPRRGVGLDHRLRLA